MANSFEKNANGMKRTVPEKILFGAVFVFFLIYAFMLIYPVAWGFLSSFKSIDDYFDNRFGLPTQLIFNNYPQAIELIENGDMTFLQMTQSCLTPSDPMDCSPPGSSIHGIFHARVLEWGAIAFSIQSRIDALFFLVFPNLDNFCRVRASYFEECPSVWSCVMFSHNTYHFFF